MRNGQDQLAPRKLLKALEKLKIFSIPLGRFIWLKANFDERQGIWGSNFVDDWT